jgi:hypothetical protein
LAALNVSVHKRIKQLEASLERLGQLNFPFGQRYVVVNIPATFAEAIEDDKVVRRYRVIVGKTEKPSPTLTADITSVNLNPTWTVPSSIAKSEISAHMRKDPSYLSRMHMEVLGANDARDHILAALKGASGVLRGALGKRKAFISVPELEFRYDDSVERGGHVFEVLEHIRRDDAERKATREESGDVDAPADTASVSVALAEKPEASE